MGWGCTSLRGDVENTYHLHCVINLMLCCQCMVNVAQKGGPNAAYQTMDADVEGSFMLDDDDVPSGHEVPGESGLHRGPQSHTALNL